MTAIRNAVEHYRVDDILIATFGGQRSQWLADGLVEEVRSYTDKPVEHVEVGSDETAARETAGAAAGGSAGATSGATAGATATREQS